MAKPVQVSDTPCFDRFGRLPCPLVLSKRFEQARLVLNQKCCLSYVALIVNPFVQIVHQFASPFRSLPTDANNNDYEGTPNDPSNAHFDDGSQPSENCESSLDPEKNR